jgi:hypothetical protein
MLKTLAATMVALFLVGSVVDAQTTAAADAAKAADLARFTAQTSNDFAALGQLLADVYGNTAVITGAGRFRVTARGEKLDNQLRYTNVWVLRDGRWQMVSWQSTKIP